VCPEEERHDINGRCDDAKNEKQDSGPEDLAALLGSFGFGHKNIIPARRFELC